MNDNDYGGGDDPFRRRGGFRGGGPPGSNFRSSPPPFAFDRGSARGRGRGRGGQGRGFGGADSRGFTGNSRGGRPMYHSTDEIDFEVQQWSESTEPPQHSHSFPFTFVTSDESPQSGRNTPGGRGRGSPSIHSGNNTPRGRGERGGRGGYTPKLPPNSSLSSLWHEERPLLRPIKFIRSVETATLFQEAEELLEPTAQTPGEYRFFPDSVTSAEIPNTPFVQIKPQKVTSRRRTKSQGYSAPRILISSKTLSSRSRKGSKRLTLKTWHSFTNESSFSLPPPPLLPRFSRKFSLV